MKIPSMKNLPASVPGVPNLPGDPKVVSEGGEATEGYRLFFSAIAQWIRANGSAIYATSAQRTTKKTRGYVDPANVVDGALFIETDRGGATYQMRAGVWVYLSGATMTGTVLAADQRPTGLGTNDTGFAFYGTDTFTVYTWSGAAWVPFRELGSILANTHATRAARPPADYASNALYLETDRRQLYANTGTIWTIARTMIHECAQADLPVDLVTTDRGFLVWVTDYSHMLEWDGSAWGWGPGNPMASGAMMLWEIDPTETGWALYDGSTVSYLQADGTLGSVTLPDLVSTTADGAYPKAGSPNSGPNAETPPTLSGGTIGSATTGISASTSAPTTTTTFTQGAGASVTVASSSHLHLMTVTDPTHTHTVSGLTASTAGEPRNLVRRPFFRQ